jgi:hypothetical protein
MVAGEVVPAPAMDTVVVGEVFNVVGRSVRDMLFVHADAAVTVHATDVGLGTAVWQRSYRFHSPSVLPPPIHLEKRLDLAILHKPAHSAPPVKYRPDHASNSASADRLGALFRGHGRREL